MPGFDGIGANEYIVDVTEPNTVDFISSVDTPYPWELNIWYQTLNVGFRTRIAGETDFPCIYDGRVGIGRTYAKLEGPLTYRSWLNALKAGRSYVSDGKTHLMDFKVNGHGSRRRGERSGASQAGTVKVTLNAAAYLGEKPNEAIRKLPLDEKPYWDIERARHRRHARSTGRDCREREEQWRERPWWRMARLIRWSSMCPLRRAVGLPRESCRRRTPIRFSR